MKDYHSDKFKRIDWIQTFTGKRFWPLKPVADDVCIEDIAHALANKCRFTGHCSKFYSVAQHSVLVSMLVPRELAIYGLLHDAAEAYLPDVASPIKPRLKGFAELEAGVLDAILVKFKLSLDSVDSEDIWNEVKKADLKALATEARDLMPNKPEDWELPFPPQEDYAIICLLPDEAERDFTKRFSQIWKSKIYTERQLGINQ